jgi:hypothetical protein
MNKIPTVFVRDPDDRKHVLPEVTPGCEWVLAGEGVATRKYDGTCVMFDGTDWWARREVKPGKQPPAEFDEISVDETTGKRMGWEPAEQTGFWKYLAEAVEDDAPPKGWQPGTFELCGPKVNGNPEGFQSHVLVRHDDAETIHLPPVLGFRTCRRAVLDLAEHGYEGIVWHHPDGRMAKLKVRDFPRGEVGDHG